MWFGVIVGHGKYTCAATRRQLRAPGHLPANELVDGIVEALTRLFWRWGNHYNIHTRTVLIVPNASKRSIYRRALKTVPSQDNKWLDAIVDFQQRIIVKYAILLYVIRRQGRNDMRINSVLHGNKIETSH